MQVTEESSRIENFPANPYLSAVRCMVSCPEQSMLIMLQSGTFRSS